MRHIREGVLYQYVDDELPQEQRASIEAHLASCRRCADALSAVTARSRRVEDRLSQLVPSAGSFTSLSDVPESVRQRLDAYETYKEEAEKPMSKPRQVALHRYSVVWIALTVVVALALSLTFPPVRAFASNVLALFRVQKIEVVEFSPSALFGGQSLDAAMRSLERVMDEQVTVEVEGEPQTVDEGTLRSLSSLRVRLPQAVEGEPHYSLQPGGTATVQVDLARIRALLSEFGYDDLGLPDELDGATVSVQLTPAVIAAYGACEPNTKEWAAAHGPGDFDGACTSLMQMKSPEISAPESLDAAQLGQVYLQLLGMSEEEARRFGERVDWTATLVIPVPRSEAAYADVQVDGVGGALIRPTVNRLPQSEYVLMWVKDGVVYALMGQGDTLEAQRIANSLQ
jgi:hypothetical protein